MLSEHPLFEPRLQRYRDYAPRRQITLGDLLLEIDERGRVLSLFAVDCLLRQNDYRTLLLACPQCENIVFDAQARAAGRCCVNGRAPSGERPVATIDLRRTS